MFNLLKSPKPAYIINVPVETADLSSTIYMVAQTFGEITIHPTTVHDAYRKNPYAGLIAKDADNNIAGFLDFFQFTPEVFEAFLNGTTDEAHLKPADILSYGDPAAQNRIYFGGVAAFTESTRERGRIVEMLLNAFARVLQSKYVTAEQPLDAYATGFSKEGKALLTRLGFTCLNDGSQRLDEQPLYHLQIDIAFLNKLASTYVRAEQIYTLNIRD